MSAPRTDLWPSREGVLIYRAILIAIGVGITVWVLLLAAGYAFIQWVTS
ncbi:membrane protein [Gordonia phage Clown]|uniref:Membrane protein n=1 Tax=Gordonia phage Clown TaxID=2759393 RepID=A0A7L7SU28_9CAUD|nr:membrane protein [Gordonia phage Clown]QOC56005.1 membrane protein [Gordonia phage Clown]